MRMRTPVFAACLAVLALAAASARGQSQDEQKALEKKIEALEKQQAEMQRQLEELKKELAAARRGAVGGPDAGARSDAATRARARNGPGHESRTDAVPRRLVGRDGTGDVGDHLQSGHLRRRGGALLRRRPEGAGTEPLPAVGQLPRARAPEASATSRTGSTSARRSSRSPLRSTRTSTPWRS